MVDCVQLTRVQDLKAVCQNHRRVKKVAMGRWLRALGLAKQAKQAKATADRHLLGQCSFTSSQRDLARRADACLEDVFATWKDATKTKTSLKRA